MFVIQDAVTFYSFLSIMILNLIGMIGLLTAMPYSNKPLRETRYRLWFYRTFMDPVRWNIDPRVALVIFAGVAVLIGFKALPIPIIFALSTSAIVYLQYLWAKNIFVDLHVYRIGNVRGLVDITAYAEERGWRGVGHTTRLNVYLDPSLNSDGVEFIVHGESLEGITVSIQTTKAVWEKSKQWSASDTAPVIVHYID